MPSSSSHHSSRSFDETSALFPIETKAEKPRPRSVAFSSRASPSAPLCDEKPMRPSGSARGANVALRPRPGTAMPRQFGPTSRAPCARTSASSCSCRSRPSAPVSAKPAEITHSARTPCRSAAAAAAEHLLAGEADHGEVDRVGDLLDRRVGADAGDGLALEVDGDRRRPRSRRRGCCGRARRRSSRAGARRRSPRPPSARRRGGARRRRPCGRAPRPGASSSGVVASGKRSSTSSLSRSRTTSKPGIGEDGERAVFEASTSATKREIPCRAPGRRAARAAGFRSRAPARVGDRERHLGASGPVART